MSGWTIPFTGKPLLPSGGMYSLGGEKTLPDLLWHMVLPVTVLALAWTAWYSRFFRASMLEVQNKDYVRTARGKGLTEKRVWSGHTFRNGVMPLVTMIGLDLPTLFAGRAVHRDHLLVAGHGTALSGKRRGRDYPVLLGVVMISAVIIVGANLFTDLTYGVIDPQVRYD